MKKLFRQGSFLIFFLTPIISVYGFWLVGEFHFKKTSIEDIASLFKWPLGVFLGWIALNILLVAIKKIFSLGKIPKMKDEGENIFVIYSEIEVLDKVKNASSEAKKLIALESKYRSQSKIDKKTKKATLSLYKKFGNPLWVFKKSDLKDLMVYSQVNLAPIMAMVLCLPIIYEEQGLSDGVIISFLFLALMFTVDGVITRLTSDFHLITQTIESTPDLPERKLEKLSALLSKLQQKKISFPEMVELREIEKESFKFEFPKFNEQVELEKIKEELLENSGKVAFEKKLRLFFLLEKKKEKALEKNG